MLKTKGFTLIEVLTAVFVFSIAMVMLGGIFVSMAKSQKYSSKSIQAINQLSYALEYMSRAIRMARKDDVGGVNCLTQVKANYEITRGGQGIKFRNYKDQCQEFYLENNQLKESKSGVVSDLTSNELNVVAFRLGPSDTWGQGNMKQPRVTLFLEAMPANQVSPKFWLQTTISQRNLNIPK